ncbi:DUF2569 domain-containing protein [Paenibacillaceae bacterium]|nr:DUF2569 domain-containing protein [Paenibacillaceae bacterium]
METGIENEKKETMQLGVSGLGGWLILIQIGLYLSITMLIIQIIGNDLEALTGETWQLLTSKDSLYYDLLWKPYLLFGSVYNIMNFIFILYILIQFYRKKSMVPRLMIIFYSLSMLIGIVDYVFIQQIAIAKELEDGGSLKDIVRSVLACLIWIPYFLKSERVMNTFIK